MNGLWEQSGVFATDGIAAPEIFCSVEGFDYSDLVTAGCGRRMPADGSGSKLEA